MFNKFEEFVKSNNLFGKNDKLLLGVSGGVDSVVMLHLVSQLKMNFAIAHCNFKLRKGDSDADEAFVQGLSKHFNVPFFNTSFDTEDFAKQNGVSIEMAARDLRYDWFEKIRSENGYQWILVAHHQDDMLETFLLNLSRGTGIRGLSGIKPVAGFVVRPMLFSNRKEIEEYALQKMLIYRTDSTNRDVRIPRNMVRISIMPMLDTLNSAFRKNMVRSIMNLNSTEQIYMQHINMVKVSVMHKFAGDILVDIHKLKKLKPLDAYLYELLCDYGFNGDNVSNIIGSMEKPGARFISSTHRLIVDRNNLIISNIDGSPIKEKTLRNTDFLNELGSIIGTGESQEHAAADILPEEQNVPQKPGRKPKDKTEAKTEAKTGDANAVPADVTKKSTPAREEDKSNSVENLQYVNKPNKRGRKPKVVVDFGKKELSSSVAVAPDETSSKVGNLQEKTVADLTYTATPKKRGRKPKVTVDFSEPYIPMIDISGEVSASDKASQPSSEGSSETTPKKRGRKPKVSVDFGKKEEQSVVTEQFLPEQQSEEFDIDCDGNGITVPVKLEISVAKYDRNFKIPKDPNVAVLDYKQVGRSLKLRKWMVGDSFMPFGMKGKKKLSDFFIDEKFSIPQKERTWLLCSKGRIAWVVGSRIDERFKLTSKSTKALIVRFVPTTSVE